MEPLGRGPGTASCEPLPSWWTSSKSMLLQCSSVAGGEEVESCIKSASRGTGAGPGLLWHVTCMVWSRSLIPSVLNSASINWNQWFSLCAPPLSRVVSSRQVSTSDWKCYCHSEAGNNIASNKWILISPELPVFVHSLKERKFKQIKASFSCASLLPSFTCLHQNLGQSTTLKGKFLHPVFCIVWFCFLLCYQT